MKRFSRLLALSFCSLGIATSASAQDILEQYYGNGVHAYFAGNNQLAEEHFNEVIKAGSQDPRVHYFRGLTQILSQGGMVEAGMADFEQAAQMEVSGKRFADVSKALSRIQGPTRIAIERIRAKARLAAKSQQFEMMRDKFEQPGTAGRTVPPAALDRAAPPATPDAGTTEPFGGGSGLTGGAPSPMPTTPNTPATNEPSIFDSPTPTTPDASMPSTGDPFKNDETPTPGGAPGIDPIDPFKAT